MSNKVKKIKLLKNSKNLNKNHNKKWLYKKQ